MPRVAWSIIAVMWLALPGASRIHAQTPPAGSKLFATAGDVTALIARARRERKPDQALFVLPIVQLHPYNVNLEYRVGGVNATANFHNKYGELFYVVEGTGTLVTGGRLKDEQPTKNPDNLQGSAIENGTSRRLAPGDWVIVPVKTPHWFTQIDGTLVLMSLHLPTIE